MPNDKMVRSTARDVVVTPEPVRLNLSPSAFYRWALDFYDCKRSFHRQDDGFSPVPFFLLGRAIELVIKARHLTRDTQQAVKTRYNHNIAEAYAALAIEEKTLSEDEGQILQQASDVYASKAFEYFRPRDALTAFSSFPDLEQLDRVARKLIDASKDLALPDNS
jgi:hypothetical protein